MKNVKRISLMTMMQISAWKQRRWFCLTPFWNENYHNCMLYNVYLANCLRYVCVCVCHLLSHHKQNKLRESVKECLVCRQAVERCDCCAHLWYFETCYGTPGYWLSYVNTHWFSCICHLEETQYISPGAGNCSLMPLHPTPQQTDTRKQIKSHV